MKIVKISKEEHDHFVEKQGGNMLQTSTWSDLKKINGWTSERFAVKDNNVIKGVVQLLFKKDVSTGNHLCYIPYGPIFDYSNKNIRNIIFKEILNLTMEKNVKKLLIEPNTNPDEELLKFMESLGFKHAGYGEGLTGKGTQPRKVMITNINQSDEDLFNSFDKGTRNLVRQSLERGATCEKVALENVNIFHELMQETGQRDKFSIRPIEYFKDILEKFDNNAELYLTKLDKNKALGYIDMRLEKIGKELEKINLLPSSKKRDNRLSEVLNQKEKINKEKKEIQNLRDDTIYLAGAILIYSGDMCYYLYAASSNQLRFLHPNHLAQWEMMRSARDKGAKFYDFGGVDENPEKESKYFGLWQFKKSWGSFVKEYIGEFEKTF